MLELQWSDKEVAAAGLSAANLDAIKKAYLRLSKKEQTEAARVREKEMKALRKLVDTLAPKVWAALEKIGVDVRKLDVQLQDLQKKPSPAKIRRIEQLGAKYELGLQKELASVGINEAAIVEKLLSIINPPLNAHVERRGLFTFVVTSVSTKGPRIMKIRNSRKEK